MFVVGSDINAWMGVADESIVDTFDRDEDTRDPVLGPYGLPETNPAGLRLKTKLAALNLVAATTFFPHNGSGKGGSFLFKGKGGNGGWKQLDHFFVKQPDLRRVQYAKTKQQMRSGVSYDYKLTPCASDHEYIQMVVTMNNVKRRKNKTRAKKTKAQQGRIPNHQRCFPHSTAR